MRKMKMYTALKNVYAEDERMDIEPTAFDYVPARRRENEKKTRREMGE